MTRELVIRTWCDLCPPESPERGYTHTLAVDGALTELDLCEAHETELALGALGKVLAEHGRLPEGATAPQPPRRNQATGAKRHGRKPDDGRERDLLCPFCPATYAHPYSLATHLTGTHGLRGPAGEITTSYGLLFPFCPLCGEPRGNMIQLHVKREHGGSIGHVWREGLAKRNRRGPLLEIERTLANVERLDS